MKGGGKLERKKKVKKKPVKPKVIKISKPIVPYELPPKGDIEEIPKAKPEVKIEPPKPDMVCPNCGGTDIKTFEGNDECVKCGFKSSARYHFKPLS